MSKYKCPTLGDCGRANNGEIFERAAGEDLKCPECKMLLEKMPEETKSGDKGKLPLLILAGVAVIGGLGGGGYYVMSKDKPVPEIKQEALPTVVTSPPIPQSMQSTSETANKSVNPSGVPPSDAETKALRQQSEAELKNGNASDAEKISNRAAANETLKLAIAKMTQGKLDEAEQDLNDARKKDPKNSLVYYNAAILRLKQGRMDDALKEFEASFMAGFKYFDKIDQDPDLASVRKDPRFIKLVAQYKS